MSENKAFQPKSNKLDFKYNLDSQLVNQLKISIDQALSQGANPLAAFDADGTLWATDLGETFFKYTFENKAVKSQLLKELPPHPWETYIKMHEENPKAGYLWLAQIYEGLPLEKVREWAQQCWDSTQDVSVFPFQKEVIDYLSKKGVETYIVTASVTWAIEPGAKWLGIPSENVIGVETETTSEGLVSSAQKGPLTWKEGKMEAFLARTQGRNPFMASGNSSGDLFLLEGATHLRCVYQSTKSGHPNFESERFMQALAQEREWFFYNFES